MTIPGHVELRKQDVVDAVQSEWADLHALVLQSAHRLTVPAEEGGWSAKDVLAHLYWGERWMAGQLGLPVSKLPPVPPTLDLADQDQRNAWFSRLDCARPLEEVLMELEDTHGALVSRLQRVPESVLNAPFQVNPKIPPPEYSHLQAQWRPLWPLWRWVVTTTFHHYRHHLPALQAWAATEEASTSFYSTQWARASLGPVSTPRGQSILSRSTFFWCIRR